MDLPTLSELLVTWGYPVLLFLLLLTGVGSPIPEDLLLVAAGYLIFAGVFGWPMTVTVCLTGVIVSDLMLYSAGRHLLGGSVAAARAPVSARRLKRATEWLDRLGPRAILLARLVPGTRAITFVSAGVNGVPAGQFLKYDAIGALLWVPVALVGGYALGPEIGRLSDVVRFLNRWAGWLLALLVVLIAARLLWGREESKL
jgi:membrane-associated protein